MSLDDEGRGEFLAEFDRTGHAEQKVIAGDFDAFLTWGTARLPRMFDALGTLEQRVLWQTVKLTRDGDG